MKTITLTDSQVWTIASFLRSASTLFDGFVKDATDNHKGLSEQFEKQSIEAKDFATQFENAHTVTMQVEDN